MLDKPKQCLENLKILENLKRVGKFQKIFGKHITTNIGKYLTNIGKDLKMLGTPENVWKI